MMTDRKQSYRMRLAVALLIIVTAVAGNRSLWAEGVSPNELPSSVVNHTYLPTVGSQGDNDVCLLFNRIYYALTWLKAKEHGWVHPNPYVDPEHVFSWQFYQMIPDMLGLQRHGCATIADTAGGWNDYGWPTREQWESALRYRIEDREAVYTHTAEGFDELKTRLSNGEIGVTTLDATPNFQDYGRVTPNPGVDGEVYYSTNGETGVGHAVTLIGYDDNKAWTDNWGTPHTGAFLAVNSWGQNWGVSIPEMGTRGFIWFSYDFVAGRSVEFYVNRPETPIEALAIVEFQHPISHQMKMRLIAGRQDDPIWDLSFSLNQFTAPIHTRIALDITEPYHQGLTDFWVESYAMDFVYHTFPLQGSVDYFALEFPDSEEPWVCTQAPVKTIGSESMSDLNYSLLTVGLFEDEGSIVDETGLNETHQIWGSFDGISNPALGVIHGDMMNPETYEFTNHTWIMLKDGEGGLRVVEAGLPDERMALASTDLDLDGRLDLVTYSRETKQLQAWSYSAFGECFTEMNVSFPAVDLGDGEGSFSIVDFNGDGRSDLATYAQSWEEESPAQFKIWFGQSDFTFTDSTIQIPLYQHARRQAMAWGDVDGDGWLDVALPVRANYISDWDGSEYWVETVVIYRNMNGGWLSEYGRCEQYDEPGPNMVWGDANNDGKPDLALSENNLLYFNRGEGNFERYVIAEDFVFGSAKIGWADINNDGWEDLVLCGNRESLSECDSEIWLNNGDETFSITGATLPGFWNGSLTPVDLDDDGDLDIIGSGFTETHPMWGERHRDLRLFRNRTAQTDGYARANTPPQAPTNLQASIDGNQHLQLWWDDASDDHTPPGDMRYHLRMGSFPGWSNLVSPAYSESEPGNSSFGQSAWMTGLPSTSFYCEVQAVDASGARSEWSQAVKVVRDGATDPCDTNEDGVIDVADIYTIAPKQPAEGDPIAPRGDVNADGVVTSLDQRYVASQLVGEPMPENDIVAVESIGRQGGTLQTEGFELWIGLDQFAFESELTLRRLPAERPDGEHSVSPMYRIQGLPEDGLTSFSLRIKSDKGFAETPLLCFGMSGWVTSGGYESLGANYLEPTEVNGNWATYEIDYGPKSRTKDATMEKGYTFEVVEGWFGMSTGKVIAYSSHFQVTFPASHDYVAITQLLDALEAAYEKYKTDFGFTYFNMPKGKIQVEVLDRGPNEYGSFINLPGRAFDKLEFNQKDIKRDDALIAITAWHEYAHYVHSQYFNSLYNTIYWIDEACAVWSEGKANSNYLSSVYVENAAAPMKGLLKGAQGNQEKHGYGMASLIKYLESRKGEKASARFWEHIGAGTNVVPNALLFMLDEGTFEWYTDYLEKHVSGQLLGYDFSDVNRDAPTVRTLDLSKHDIDKPEYYSGTKPDLSGELFQTIANNTSLPSDAVVSHRLVAPEHVDLSLFKLHQPSQIDLLGRGVNINNIAKFDVPISSFSTDGRDRVLALITNREGSFSKNYLGDTDYYLQTAVTWDRTYTLPVKSAQQTGVFQGIPAFSVAGTVQGPGITQFEEYDYGYLPGGSSAGALMTGLVIGQTPLTISLDYDATLVNGSSWELIDDTDVIYTKEYSVTGIKYYRLTTNFDGYDNPVSSTNVDGVFTIEIPQDAQRLSCGIEVVYDVQVDYLADGEITHTYTYEDQRITVGMLYFDL